MRNEREERQELDLEELNAVSGGFGPTKTGGKPKPQFPDKCPNPNCGKPVIVTKLDNGDTIICSYCGQEIHAL